ncbi:MAG: hypothetical protein AB7I33_07565 [Gemmatimonadales bacterium]
MTRSRVHRRASRSAGLSPAGAALEEEDVVHCGRRKLTVYRTQADAWLAQEE